MKKTQDYFDFLDRSPTAYHTTHNLTQRLTQAGFQTLQEYEKWILEPGRAYLVQRGDNGLIAFRVGTAAVADTGFAIACAHTDSPGLKLKPLSQTLKNGVLKVGVELYGDPILSTWLDRELSIAGRVILQTGSEFRRALVDLERPLAVIPNLAIHFNRDVNKGFAYDPQIHLSGLLQAGTGQGDSVDALLAHHLGVPTDQILDSDLYFYNTHRADILGAPDGLYTSSRIDNLAGCHAVLEALLTASAAESTQVGVFFDAEEVGSTTVAGADSSFFTETLERITKVLGGGDEDFFRAKARSFLVSVDAAHGVHPNFADRHDPQYAPQLGGGPVIKSSGRNAYASNAATAARFEALAEAAGQQAQRFIIRSDLTGGMTVGPMSAASSGIATVDVGEPIWAMHSIRETGDLRDHWAMIATLTGFFRQKTAG